MSAMALDDAILKLTEYFAKPWAEAVSELLGVPHKVTFSSGTLADPGANPLCMAATLEGSILGDVALVLAAADLQILCNKPGQPAAESSEATAATQAQLQQKLREALVLALKNFQAQDSPLVGRIEPSQLPSWTPNLTVVLEASGEGVPAHRLYLLCSQNLRLNSADAAPDQSARSTGADDLIMNAALEVTLRFGQQQLSLARLAALGPGAVIELDRRVEQPIELILGGRVLARGEVMIVDGNYGLRVTELCDRREL